MNLKEKDIDKIYEEVSPFEFKDILMELAKENSKESDEILDAGRGNPNWVSVTPREAFFTFGYFAMEESRRVWSDSYLGGMAIKKGIHKRFEKFLEDNKNLKSIDLLEEMINYGIKVMGYDGDEFIYELVEGIIGDNYPSPDRMLVYVEDIVRQYLMKELQYNKEKGGNFNVFAVEGATAAMCYVFDSLVANHLLEKKDKIAIMVPVFTPYLEIPLLPNYDFKIVPIKAKEASINGYSLWQYPDSELEKLKDNDIKALFMVNPGNPSSMAIDKEGINKIIEVIENHNKDLMVISDDVYGTFVDDYKSLMSELPFNTLGVYSYSKYFGVTGWRLGTIALHDNNIFDKLLRELPKEKKEDIARRYAQMTPNIEKVSFLDRIVADSRQVALNHTAGLSTPQQVQMAFFSLLSLLDSKGEYRRLTNRICHKRQKLFYEGLGLEIKSCENDAAYYAELDFIEWSKCHYGEEFATYLKNQYKPVDILTELADKYGIILLGCGGFEGPEWSVRVSLANLNDEDYVKIGTALHDIIKEYIDLFEEAKVLV